MLIADAWASPSRPTYQPAYTPSEGRAMAPGTATFAVGNPIVRPRASPCSTMPRTSYGRPRSRLAVATSPAAKALRIAPADMGAPSSESCRNGMLITFQSVLAPMLAIAAVERQRGVGGKGVQ